MIIILNHKCNLTKTQYLNYQKELLNIKTKHHIILCPSSCYLSYNELKDISLGSQDCSPFNMGAHTGEISALQLKSLGIKYCLVGHSERRIEKEESIEEVCNKIKNLLNNDITPILCIGETIEEKNNNLTKDIIKNNIQEVLLNFDDKEKDHIIIAYEPLWAIGTDKIPTEQELTDIFEYIKGMCPNNKLIYGGSVTEKNISSLKNIDIINGYLLGRISLDVSKIKKLLETI